MKKNLLTLIILMATAMIPAVASVTVEEMSDTEYVLNQGYSQMMAEDVFMLKNRANGKPAEPLYNSKHSGLTKLYKSIFGYIDPSIDEADRIHHDIHPSPSFADL